MPYGFNSDADDDDVNVNTCNKILTSKGHPKWYIEQISHCVFIVIFQVCNCEADGLAIFYGNICIIPLYKLISTLYLFTEYLYKKLWNLLIELLKLWIS